MEIFIIAFVIGAIYWYSQHEKKSEEKRHKGQEEEQGQGSLEFVVRVAQALQVTTQLEPLFETPTTRSIAQMEKDAAVNQRQRASIPRTVQKRAHEQTTRSL